MSILDTLAGWARSAWGLLTSLGGDAARALTGLWHYVTALHDLLAWLAGNPILQALERILWNASAEHLALAALRAALARVAGWIYATFIAPLRSQLLTLIGRLRAWTAAQLAAQLALIWRLYAAARAYAAALTAAERAARIKAVQAEHAAMIRTVDALHAAVEHEAAAGYAAGRHARTGIITSLLNDIADRQPELKHVTSVLVNAIIDLESIDNPVIRFGIGKLLNEVIGHLGVDKITGDLISALLGPLTGGGPPAGLFAVEKDTADRLAALEQQWADFMTAGGPEVEQAGRSWKNLTSVLADAGLLAMFSLAVTEPAAWATAMADTAGVAGNAALTQVVSLLNRL